MTPDTRLLLCAVVAVSALIVLIARFKLHPFIALISVSLAMGVAAGMPLAAAVKAFQDGVGNTLGFIAIVVGLGTMLGKIMAESRRGDAYRDDAHRTLRREPRALGHHGRRVHRRHPGVLSGGVRSARPARVHDRASHGIVAHQDRHPAGGRALGRARDAAAASGGDARGGGVQRRRRSHDSLRIDRGSPDGGARWVRSSPTWIAPRIVLPADNPLASAAGRRVDCDSDAGVRHLRFSQCLSP